MDKIHLTAFINAPRQKVWDFMLGKGTYEQWTEAFNPGSRYEGSWDEGASIRFVGPNPDGSGEGGMISRIAANRPHEFMSIEHVGIIHNGQEITEGEFAEKWIGIHENYTFVDRDGGTELTVDMDIPESEKAYMEESWKKALVKLKELVEAA